MPSRSPLASPKRSRSPRLSSTRSAVKASKIVHDAPSFHPSLSHVQNERAYEPTTRVRPLTLVAMVLGLVLAASGAHGAFVLVRQSRAFQRTSAPSAADARADASADLAHQETKTNNAMQRVAELALALSAARADSQALTTELAALRARHSELERRAAEAEARAASAAAEAADARAAAQSPLLSALAAAVASGSTDGGGTDATAAYGARATAYEVTNASWTPMWATLRAAATSVWHELPLAAPAARALDADWRKELAWAVRGALVLVLLGVQRRRRGHPRVRTRETPVGLAATAVPTPDTFQGQEAAPAASDASAEADDAGITDAAAQPATQAATAAEATALDGAPSERVAESPPRLLRRTSSADDPCRSLSPDAFAHSPEASVCLEAELPPPAPLGRPAASALPEPVPPIATPEEATPPEEPAVAALPAAAAAAQTAPDSTATAATAAPAGAADDGASTRPAAPAPAAPAPWSPAAVPSPHSPFVVRPAATRLSWPPMTRAASVPLPPTNLTQLPSTLSPQPRKRPHIAPAWSPSLPAPQPAEAEAAGPEAAAKPPHIAPAWSPSLPAPQPAEAEAVAPAAAAKPPHIAPAWSPSLPAPQPAEAEAAGPEASAKPAAAAPATTDASTQAAAVPDPPSPPAQQAPPERADAVTETEPSMAERRAAARDWALLARAVRTDTEVGSAVAEAAVAKARALRAHHEALAADRLRAQELRAAATRATTRERTNNAVTTQLRAELSDARSALARAQRDAADARARAAAAAAAEARASADTRSGTRSPRSPSSAEVAGGDPARDSPAKMAQAASDAAETAAAAAAATPLQKRAPHSPATSSTTPPSHSVLPAYALPRVHGSAPVSSAHGSSAVFRSPPRALGPASLSMQLSRSPRGRGTPPSAVTGTPPSAAAAHTASVARLVDTLRREASRFPAESPQRAKLLELAARREEDCGDAGAASQPQAQAGGEAAEADADVE